MNRKIKKQTIGVILLIVVLFVATIIAHKKRNNEIS